MIVLTKLYQSKDRKLQATSSAQKMPSLAFYNSVISERESQEMNARFIPVIPKSVTKSATVYKALENFQSILAQLHQTKLAVTCDERVYHIARGIM